ncbi:hypothetical protein K440DRAFT_664987 [Wilcoxina mikolae CBS 423.85]|nr:hypothetical protein K440DRAFT_664987 [Wilcoxina mikolae CBS 423.85]
MSAATESDKHSNSTQNPDNDGLEVLLAFSLSECTPVIALPASDIDDPLEITVSARVKWSFNPSLPITISTRHTHLDTEHGDITTTMLTAVNKDNADKQLPLRKSTVGLVFHHKTPYTRDWREEMQFITIPSQESGRSVSVKLQLPRSALLLPGPHGPALPGETYGLNLFDMYYKSDASYRVKMQQSCIWWWQWGDLDKELKDKKFEMRYDRLNTTPSAPSGPEWVQGFEGLEMENDYEIIRVEIEGEGKDVRLE